MLGASTPAHDVLVRNTRRSERHLALDGSEPISRPYDWPSPKPGELKHGPQEAATVETDMVVMLHA